MSDLKQRILDLIHRPQMAALATVTEMGNPWVRYVVTVGDGDLVLRCATKKDARKAEQIIANPDVHLTLGGSLTESSPYVQIQARAEISTDSDEKNNFWNDMLEPVFSGADDPDYAVVVITPYRIEYCTPGTYEAEVWVR